MPSALERVRAELDDTMRQAEAITEREDFNPQDSAYVALRERAEELSAGYKELVSWQNTRAETDRIGATLRAAEKEKERESERQRSSDVLTPGEMFVRSDEFRLYANSGKTPRFEIPDAFPILTRALPSTTAAWAAAITPPPPRDITAPLAPTPLLDLIPAIPWGSDVVNYVTYAKVAGGAAVVAEGAAKPSGEWAPTGTSAPLKKIAVYTEATRELLEAPGAVRSKIDTLLVNDVRRVAEAEAAAALTAATLPTATGGGSLLSAIRVGIGTVQGNGYNPNAVLLNPADWAAMDTEIFYQSQYGTTVNQTFWGIRPIASPAQPAGTATVGDFSSGMERYIRSAMSVYITDSHNGNFTLNIFTLLAEVRELSAVVRPNAMCECSAGTPPVAGGLTRGSRKE